MFVNQEKTNISRVSEIPDELKEKEGWQNYSHRVHVYDLVNFNPADILTGSGVS